MSSSWDVRIIVLLATVVASHAASSLCLNGTITASSGVMDDGTPVGQNYANRLFCERLIVAPAGQRVVVTITRFATESKYDLLTFFDRPNATLFTIAQLSGTSLSLPYIVRSTKSVLLVRFTSDDSVAFDGFEFSWVFAAAALGAQWTPILNSTAAPFGANYRFPLLEFNKELVLITTNINAEVWASADGGFHWRMLASNVFPWRLGESAVIYDNRIWLIGGVRGGQYVPDVLYSSNGVDWSMDPGLAPFLGRDAHSSVVFNGSICMVGGWCGASNFCTDVWTASVRYPGAGSLSWSLATADYRFPARYGHGHVVHLGQMFVIAGFTPGNVPTSLNDVWRSGNGRDWTLVTSAAPFAIRCYAVAAAVYAGRLWVIGGGIAYLPIYKDVWSSPDGASWALEPIETPFGIRWTYSTVVFNSRMILIGGTNATGSSVADVWAMEIPQPSTLPGSLSPSVTPTRTPRASTSPTPSGTKTMSHESSITPSNSPSLHSTFTATPSQSDTESSSATLARTRTPPPAALRTDCIGQWRPHASGCSATCGAGILAMTFEVTTPVSNGGRPCEVTPRSTRTTACALQACDEPTEGKVPLDCRGVFVTTSPCNAECDGGQLIETFLIATKASGDGMPCEFTTGYTRTQPCNTDSCGLSLKAVVGFVQRHLWLVLTCGLIVLAIVLLIMSLTCCCCCRKRRRRQSVDRMEAYRVHDSVGPHQMPLPAFPRFQAAGPLRHLPPPLNPDFQPNVGPGRLYPDPDVRHHDRLYPELDVERGPNLPI